MSMHISMYVYIGQLGGLQLPKSSEPLSGADKLRVARAAREKFENSGPFLVTGDLSIHQVKPGS